MITFCKSVVSLQLICVLVSATILISDNSPVISTNLGDIRGSVLNSRLGREFFAFRGVPYAEPPIDDLRFKVHFIC